MALVAPPGLDLRVVAGEQHVGHPPAAILGRPRVVRVLDAAPERLGERLDERALLASERTREAARHRVQQHHRRQLPAGEDVGPDRDRLGGEAVDDALVEALEASREERQQRLGRELLDELLVELASLGRERDDPRGPRAGAVDRLERGVDDVDPEHHAGAAAVRLVVHLPGPERREVPVAEQVQLELRPQDGGERTPLGHPGERLRYEREDIDAHGANRTARAHPPGSGRSVTGPYTSPATIGGRRARRPPARPPTGPTRTRRDHDPAGVELDGSHAVLDERQQEAGVELEHVVRDARYHPNDPAQQPARLDLDVEALELERVELALRKGRQLLGRQLEQGPAGHGPVQPDHRPAGGSLRLDHRRRLAVDVDPGATREALRILARILDDECAVDSVRPPDAPDAHPARFWRRVPRLHSAISSRRRSPGFVPLARTIVRNARMTRPWRPITFPTSSLATWRRSTIAPSRSVRSTRTSSGCSTSCRAT